MKILLSLSQAFLALYYFIPGIIGLIQDQSVKTTIWDFLLIFTGFIFSFQVMGTLAPSQRHPDHFKWLDLGTMILFVISEVILLLSHSFSWFIALFAVIVLGWSFYHYHHYLQKGVKEVVKDKETKSQ